jgi:Major Facilitator Superfamily/CGNR zinc finger
VLSVGVLMLTGAVVGDRLGRRRMFVAGLLVFSAASAAAALAPSTGWLIAARAIQGAGAALIMPLSLALLSAAFPPNRRGAAIGAWSAIIGTAVAIGPLVGGAIVAEEEDAGERVGGGREERVAVSAVAEVAVEEERREEGAADRVQDDTGRNGRRVYCSRRCANRVNASRHRRRTSRWE